MQLLINNYSKKGEIKNKLVILKDIYVCFVSFSVDAVPCRIAFERGKERHFCFLAVSLGTSGWLVLAEELPFKPSHGIVRVVAPLAGCNVSFIVFFFEFLLHVEFLLLVFN